MFDGHGEPALRPNEQRVTPEQIKSSAIRAVEAILPLDILPRHKCELISAMTWKITEAEGLTSTLP